MFKSYTTTSKYSLRVKHDNSEVINIFTCEDIEKSPPESQAWFHMNFTGSVFSSKTFMFLSYSKFHYQVPQGNSCILFSEILDRIRVKDTVQSHRS